MAKRINALGRVVDEDDEKVHEGELASRVSLIAGLPKKRALGQGATDGGEKRTSRRRRSPSSERGPKTSGKTSSEAAPLASPRSQRAHSTPARAPKPRKRSPAPLWGSMDPFAALSAAIARGIAKGCSE
jgi:hypothetical protein